MEGAVGGIDRIILKQILDFLERTVLNFSGSEMEFGKEALKFISLSQTKKL